MIVGFVTTMAIYIYTNPNMTNNRKKKCKEVNSQGVGGRREESYLSLLHYYTL